MGSRPEILFLHGALGVARDLDPMMEFLKAKGYKTSGFNFSGHGPTSLVPSDFRIDFFAHELDQFLSEHQMKNVVVFGYSMGGYVALYHKANFENSPISMIMTYGTKFNWSEGAVAKELPMLDPDHMETKFPQIALKLKEKHGEKWKHLMRSTAHMMSHLQRLDGLTREDLNELDIPVCLVLGDQDRMVSTEETTLTSSWIPHSQVKTLAHSKHDLERTNLKELSEILERFISGH